MYVRDLDGVEYVVQTSPTQSYELNSNITLKATILPTKTNKAFIEDIAEMWSIFDFDDVEHRILFVERRGKGDKQYVEIQAIPKFFDVLDNDRIYEEYNEHMTAKVAFDRIFDSLPFTYRFVDTFYAVEWEGFGAGESKLETFSRALERYKAEFRIVGNVVYLESKIGRDTQFMYRHGLNASNISVQTDAKEMWTIARGYGDFEDGEESENGGWQNAKLDRTYISPLAKIPSIGYRHAPPIKNGTIKVKSTMDANLKRLVDESVKVSVTADLHDLRKQGYPLAQPELGDRVFLIDERIGFNEEVRVVSITVTKNWRGDIEDLELTFGEIGISQRYKSGLSTATKHILDLFEGRKKLPFYAYDSAVQQATKDLNNARTELYFPDEGGIWAVEKTNPNYLTRLTSKGLGVSDDGGATFRTAVTGRGVVAEEIIGKLIVGANLVIENEKLTFSVDGDGVTLDGGALRITNGLKDSDIRSSDKWNSQGTYIDDKGIYTGTLTAGQVQIGFNKIGNSVKVIPSGLETYNGGEKTSRLYGSGHEFFRGGTRVGKIGTASWYGHPNHRGLSFQLDDRADYFSFGLEEDIEDVYSAKLMWHKNSNATARGFTFNDDVRVAGDFTASGRTSLGQLTVSQNNVDFGRDLSVSQKISGGSLDVTGDIKIGNGGFIRRTSSSIRLAVNESTYINMNQNGNITFVSNGQVFQVFSP